MGKEGEPVGQKPIDIGELRDKLQQLAEWARSNLWEAQENQRHRYDSQVKEREFNPGDKVLLLLPTSETKLLAKWQGPYVVNRRVGKVDYEVRTPDKQRELKIFHVNLLKAWKERAQEVSLGEELGPSAIEAMGAGGSPSPGETLNPQQASDLVKVQREFPLVFSKKPGMTKLVQHHIKVKGDKVVRLPPRKWPKHLEEVLNKEVEAMLELGVRAVRKRMAQLPSFGAKARRANQSLP